MTHPDRLITKHMLLDTLWTKMAVSDAVVRVAIRGLRKGLGDTVQILQSLYREEWSTDGFHSSQARLF